MQENHDNTIQWGRILTITGFSLIFLAFVYWHIIFVQGSLIRQAESAYMQEQIRAMEKNLSEIQQECQFINESFTQDPLLAASLQKIPREGTKGLSLPGYDAMQKKYARNDLQLISGQGMVLWSTNNSSQKGEDVSYQRLVLASLQEKGKVNALESVDSNLNVVSTVPLFNENKYIGVSKLRMPLDKALERRLPKNEKGKQAIFQLNGIQRSQIWGEEKSQTVINTGDIKKIHQGEAFYRPTTDKKLMLLIFPLKDIDNIPIAYMQREISRQTFQEARTNNILLIIIMTLIVLFTNFLLLVGDEFDFSSTKPESFKLKDSGKISRVSIHVKPIPKEHAEDEKS